MTFSSVSSSCSRFGSSPGAGPQPRSAVQVRDYTKWDDLPISLPHFAESTVRAYRIAMTPPREPVVIVIDSQLQEVPIAKDATFHIPKLALDAPPRETTARLRQ